MNPFMELYIDSHKITALDLALLKGFKMEKSMGSLKINEPQHINSYNAKLGELRAGTIVTGIPSHPSSTYIKVEKHKNYSVPADKVIAISWPKDHCILCNLNSGSFRAIPGDTIVAVLEGVLNLQYADAKGHKK